MIINTKTNFSHSDRNNVKNNSQGCLYHNATGLNNTLYNSKTQGILSFTAKSIPYCNMFPEQLKASPNPNLKGELEQDNTVYDLDLSFERLTAFSRYLKEEMIGFKTPSGIHWFEKALINLIYGAKSTKVPESEYKDTAKELWSLIAKADSYWTSENFIQYLSSMKQSPARDATIEAIKEIKIERNSRASNISFGYKSDLKKIQRLLDNGCAYSGVKMERTGGWPNQVTVEHIFSSYDGGHDTDENFILTTSKANDDRGNLPLIDFLKGKSRKRK